MVVLQSIIYSHKKAASAVAKLIAKLLVSLLVSLIVSLLVKLVVSIIVRQIAALAKNKRAYEKKGCPYSLFIIIY